MQVVPATQVPLPVHPVPPHCVYLESDPPVDAGAAEELTTEVASVVPAVEEAAPPLAAAPPGLLTAVVREPDSM